MENDEKDFVVPALAGLLATAGICDSVIFKSAPFPDGLIGLHKSYPRMDGRVMLFHSTATLPGQPNVVIMPLGAAAPVSVSLWPADSVAVPVYDVSAGRDHKIVAVLQAINRSEQRAWLTMLLNASGKVVGEFRTNPWVGLHVAVDDTGDIWAAGVDHDALDHHADYNILRKYSPEGLLLLSTLPRSSFPTRLDPAESVGGLDGMTFLRAHGSNVAVFISQTREWIEVAGDGRVVSRARVQMPATAYPDMTNVIAITDDGGVFLGAPGFSLCKLDTRSGVCRSVKGPEDGLLGADGNDLLFHRPENPTEVSWAHQ